jgi:kynurenine formamidase
VVPVASDLPDYADLMARTDAPPGSTWGLFGDGVTGDVGTIGLLGPEQLMRGVASVVDGECYSLNYPIDAFEPPMLGTRPAATMTLSSRHSEHLDDVLDRFNPQSSSQIDGLRHRRHERHGFYNGVPATEVGSDNTRLGTQGWAERGIVGRGLVLDAQEVLAGGDSAWHEEGAVITADQLEEVLVHHGLRPEVGDIVVLHTGWAHWYLDELDDADRARCRTAGRYTGVAQARSTIEWLWDHRVSLVASDTFAFEVIPPMASSEFSSRHDGGLMHQELIGLLGLAMGELWDLHDLAAACRSDGRRKCLVTSAPLHVPGGVSTPANALAMR